MSRMDFVQPYRFLYGYNFKEIQNILKIVTISKISIKYAKAKFYILDLALKGSKDPINEFEKRFKKIIILKI